MSDISVPKSLSSAEAILSLATSLQTFIDPSERKKIADEVRAFHALNDTEARKAQEARDTIKQNSSILQENQKIAALNEQNQKQLVSDRAIFEEEKRHEYQKISDAKLPANEALVRAQQLRDEAKGLQDDVAAREKALDAERAEHEKNVLKLGQDKESFGEDKKALEEKRTAILNLEKQTNEKLQKLKQMNF